jgi:large subunit ribosomal protein L6
VSRIGNVLIPVPQGVDVKITPDMKVTVKGPKGQLELDTQHRVSVTQEDGGVHVQRPDDTQQSRAYHGLYQRLLSSMVKGVSEGFSKQLELIGVGYRVAKAGTGLTFNLGYSHPINFPAPVGITFDAPDATNVVVSGFDKQLVGQIAANIRRLRPPEPYKGKGIRYKGEHVRRKVGKSGSK